MLNSSACAKIWSGVCSWCLQLVLAKGFFASGLARNTTWQPANGLIPPGSRRQLAVKGDTTLEWSMPQDSKDKSATSSRKNARTQRLEAQMRENLKRRKAQARARMEGEGLGEDENAAVPRDKDQH